MIPSLLKEHGIPAELVELANLADAIVVAAESVCASYRAHGGYTVPLSINLRRLDDAVREWQQRVAALSLNSDTNGFDRSSGWGEGSVSNEQSHRGAQAKAERWACRPSSGVGGAENEAEPAKASPPRRTRAAHSPR